MANSSVCVCGIGLESPLTIAAFTHGELFPKAGLFNGRCLFVGLAAFIVVFEHVEQAGLDAGFVGVELHVVLPLLVVDAAVGRVLAVDECLLQVSHHLFADRLFH